FHPQEKKQRNDRQRQRQEKNRMVPAGSRQLIDGVDKEAVGHQQKQRAGNIHGDFFLQPGFRDHLPGQVRAPQTEGQVDIKNPAPADAVDQKAAERGPGQKAHVKSRGGETEGAAALLRRQVHRDDGAAVGGDHRAANRLQRAEENQLPRAARQAAKSRGGHEDQKTDAVKQPPAEQIAEPAHGDDQADENQIVDQNRPLNRRERGFERARQRGQGDQQGALIEADHGLADAHAQKNQPRSLPQFDRRVGGAHLSLPLARSRRAPRSAENTTESSVKPLTMWTV